MNKPVIIHKDVCFSRITLGLQLYLDQLGMEVLHFFFSFQIKKVAPKSIKKAFSTIAQLYEVIFPHSGKVETKKLKD